MKYRHVFLLGRPGCGKSALYGELKRRIQESGRVTTFERVDDFPKVWARIQADDARAEAGKERLITRTTDDGLWVITDLTFFDEVLREVSSDVLEIAKPDHLIFIEFARASYVAAMRNFDRSILDDCLMIYIEVSFELCWARNVARYDPAAGQGGDAHTVGREAMEEIYLHDDRDAFVQHMKEQGIPVLVVNNEAEGEEHLQRQVDIILDRII